MVFFSCCLLALLLNAYTIQSFQTNRCQSVSSKRCLHMGYEVKDLKSLTVKEMLNAVSGMYICIYIHIYFMTSTQLLFIIYSISKMLCTYHSTPLYILILIDSKILTIDCLFISSFFHLFIYSFIPTGGKVIEDEYKFPDTGIYKLVCTCSSICIFTDNCIYIV
jgi:hypothetical protein